MMEPTLFEEHVTAYKIACVLRGMRDRGEINELDGRSTIRTIVMEVLERHPGVTIAHIKGVSRMRYIIAAKHEAMYELKVQRPDLSFPAIAKWFGDMDHTSVLSAFRKIERQKAAAKESE